MNTLSKPSMPLARQATIFAILLTISLGLCGANAALFDHFGAVSGGEPAPPRSSGASFLLMATGALELAGIAIGALGLLVVGITAILRRIFRKPPADDDTPYSGGPTDNTK